MEVQSALLSIFKRYGKPEYFKVDNGLPLGDPSLETLPVMNLWLQGMGIKVILNPPGRPQKNGTVERSQGTLSRWTEYRKCNNTKELQKRLKEEIYFCNHQWPNRKRKGKTLVQVYPNFTFTGRKWDAEDFNLNLALDALSDFTWKRIVSKKGQVKMLGHRFSLGNMEYKHKTVSIKINVLTNQWNVFDDKGNLVCIKPTRYSKDSLWNLDLSICQ